MASPKEKVWLAEYLKCFNATLAARRAGYTWPNKQGPQKKQKFAKEIAEALEERVMGKDEALAHLADIARMDLSEYLIPDGIDTDAMVRDGKGHLIAGVRRVVTKFDDRLEVDLLDKQGALNTILKHYDPGSSEDNPLHVINYIKENRPDGDDGD